MNKHSIGWTLAMWVIWSTPAMADQTAELAALKKELATLRADYEHRIAALEKKIEETQRKAQSLEEASLEPSTTTSAAANAFNPAIGLILNGQYASFSRPDQEEIPGFSLPEEAGKGDEGFSLGESELSLSTDIDDKFYGNLILSFSGEEGVEVEEAFIQTTALGHGLTIKGGRFLSGIGYLNERHAHADAFADRPLPYRAMLNTAYSDDGIQFRWLAPTDLYLNFGTEILRGAHYPAGGGGHGGAGAHAIYAHAGSDVGISNSWRAGLSYLNTDNADRESGDADLFTGDSDLWIADFVWKWAPNGDFSQRNLTLQGEYLYRREDGLFRPGGNPPLAYDARQQGWYAQAVYQFMPQWRLGLRLSGLSANDPGPGFSGTALDPRGMDPWMASVMIDWANSEFSRVRLQYNRDESGLETDNAFILQYIMSMGAHGAHAY